VLNHKLSKKAIRIVLDFQEQSPRIMGYVSELNQIWTSLIDNAIDAMSPGGELRISSHTEGNFFFVIVRDNGMGIVPEILPKIFDPFFTTKSVGQGTGLGLDIVNRVLINHNATIKVKSEPGKTEFCLCFPISD
jgi:signal transduction histidine kinase